MQKCRKNFKLKLGFVRHSGEDVIESDVGSQQFFFLPCHSYMVGSAIVAFCLGSYYTILLVQGNPTTVQNVLKMIIFI